MSETETKVQPNTYGNITKPRRSGLLGLSAGQSALGVPAVLILIFSIVGKHFWFAGIFVLLCVVSVVLLKVGRRHDRSIYRRVMLRRVQKRKVRKQQHIYISGPAGFTPTGDTRLPGMMARAVLTNHVDAYGHEFGLVRVSGRGHHNYSVVLQAFPRGKSALDRDTVENQVAHWGAWITQRGQEEGVRGASVTIESAPDTGLRLQRLLEKNFKEDAPEFSKEVVDEYASTGPTGAPQISVFVTLTFDGRNQEGASGDRGAEDMAEEISSKLPGIIAGLVAAGGGAIRPCTAQGIVDNTRAAYDPTTATAIEEMQQTEEGTGLTWMDAGPSFAFDGFDHYRHDRVFSRTWTMYGEPRGTFTSNALDRLLEPSEGALRKRVTLLYRPIPADKTTDVVDQETKDAIFAGSQVRMSARAKQRQAYALKSAEEEALGAGMTRFGLIITVTTDQQEKLRRFNTTVPGMLSNAKLKVRIALANQAVAFQAGLPLGMVLPDHMVIPEEVREWF